MILLLLFTFCVSFTIGMITIPNIIIISKRKRLFDTVNDRKAHSNPVPRLGGISFLPSIIFSFCITIGVQKLANYDITAIFQSNIWKEFSFFISGLILIFMTGLADDLVGVSYKRKFLMQIVVASLVTIGGIYIKNFHGLFGLYEIPVFAGVLLTIFIIVGIINAFNLIDGVDGLCSGLSIIAIAYLSGWFMYYKIFTYAILGVSTMGILIAFFTFNVSPLRKKIFMGDCGSLILGYIIAFMGFKFVDLNDTNVVFNTPSVLIMFLSIVFVPVFDCIRVFAQRIANHKSPFYPDKTHIHHMFLKLGYTHLQSTGLIMIMALIIIIINSLLQNIDINILFIIDILLGLIFLNLLPKYAIRRKEYSAKNKK